MTLESRELHYFVVVAEELHFGRAADRLGMTQPPLSRAIRQLERRLGVALLDRTGRSVALTHAGEVLLTEGHAALEAVAAAGRRAQRAGGERTLVLATKPAGDGGLLPDILAEFAATYPACRIDIVCSVSQRAAMLRDGRADAALLYAPREDFTGLATQELLTEPQVALLARDHHLAGRAELTLADLSGDPMPYWPHLPESDTGGPRVDDIGQLMQLVALGRLVAVGPESVRDFLRPGIVCIPVADAAPTTLVLGWPESSRDPALAVFVQCAAKVAANRD